MRLKVAVLLGLASAIVCSLADFTPTEAGRHRRHRSRCCQCCPPQQVYVPPTIGPPCQHPASPGSLLTTTWRCIVYTIEPIGGGVTVYYAVDCSTSAGYYYYAQDGLSAGNCSNPAAPECYEASSALMAETGVEGCPLIHPTYRPMTDYGAGLKLSPGCRDTLPGVVEVRFQITENGVSRDVVARVHSIEADPANFDPPRAGEKVLRGGIGYEVRQPQGTPQQVTEVHRVAEGAYCITLKVGDETRKFGVLTVQR